MISLHGLGMGRGGTHVEAWAAEAAGVGRAQHIRLYLHIRAHVGFLWWGSYSTYVSTYAAVFDNPLAFIVRLGITRDRPPWWAWGM